MVVSGLAVGGMALGACTSTPETHAAGTTTKTGGVNGNGPPPGSCGSPSWISSWENRPPPSCNDSGGTIDWTGDYQWQSPETGTPITDVVLLTLLQSPSGFSGTWTETAINAQDAVALNGDETAIPPNNSFPVNVVPGASNTLTLTVESDARTTFDASIAYTGRDATTTLFLTYTPLGGGIRTLDFNDLGGPSGVAVGAYDEVAQAIAQECTSGAEQCK
jgi:hypothetical protein